MALAIKLAIVAVYFAALFWIGAAASKRVGNLKDYFVAGKGLGYWMVSFSSRATGESGWLLLGLTGMGYSLGVHSLWVALGEVFGVTIAWVFLTQRFKAMTDRYDSITVPDFLESRLGDTSHTVRIIASLFIAIFVTAYVSGQFTASGKAFEGFLGIPYGLGVILGLVIVLFYTVAGGFVAVAWSDLLQGIMMLAGLILVPVAALLAVGGITDLGLGLRGIDPSLVSVWGPTGRSWAAYLSALGLFSIGWGFFGSPQLFVRFIAVKDIRELKNGSVVAVVFTILTDIGAILTGMCGRLIYDSMRGAPLADPEHVFPALAGDLFPAALTGLFVAIVLAAIMSTADSLLVLASSALVRDLWEKVHGIPMGPRESTILSRYATLIIALLAVLFALGDERVVFWFILFGWSGLSSVFCPVVLLGLYWRRLTRGGAVMGMLTGAAVTFIWKAVPMTFWYGIIPGLGERLASMGFSEPGTLSDVLYEMVPAFLLATLSCILVSLLTRPPKNAKGDLDAARGEVMDLLG